MTRALSEHTDVEQGMNAGTRGLFMLLMPLSYPVRFVVSLTNCFFPYCRALPYDVTLLQQGADADADTDADGPVESLCASAR